MDRNAVPDIITDVSNSYFSIARYAESCTIHGREFVYFPDDDTLVRKDVVATYSQKREKGKRRINHG